MPENPSDAPPTTPPPPPQPPPVGAPPPGNSESQARTWQMLCHLSALAVFVPFGNILGPLLVWQIKKHEFPSIEPHGKASVNFQITVTIAVFCVSVAAVILHFFCIGFLLLPLIPLILLAGLVFAVIAGIKANNGEPYRYPFSLEFVK